MKKQAIIYDLDGTLIDSTKTSLQRILQIATKHGLPINPNTKKELLKLWKNSTPGRIMIQSVWPDANLKKFFDDWVEFDSRNIIPCFPGICETLNHFHAHGFVQCLLTSRDCQSAIAQLMLNKIFSFFYSVQTIENCVYSKPDPRTITPMMKKLAFINIGAKDAVCVGDALGDLKMAKSAGIDFIGVLSGGCNRSDFVSLGLAPQNILKSATELPRLLSKNA